MKRLLVLILSVVAAFTAIISLTACGKTDFTVKFSVDGEIYATVSTGGSEAIKMPADPQKDGYTFDGWFLDDGVWASHFTAESLLNEPLKSDITVYAKFSVNHSHNFNKKIAEERFLKSAATCVSKAVYYFSCKCGEKGEQTFEYGEPLPHSYNADRICENCGYIKPSEGLRYVLNDDESGYICVGIGSCDDTYVVIPSVYNGLPVVAIGEEAFSNTNRYPKNSITKMTIPDSVTDIGVSAFSGCGLLTSINIPASVTIISDKTFYDCSSLTEIIIPDGVTSIGNGAFSDCNSLTSAAIPSGATCISDNLFYGCESLTDITIPDGVTSIGYHAFEECSALASINIPDRVTEIYGFAFFRCTSLTSLTIPVSVTSIGDWAFDGCRKLAEIINNSNLNIVKGEIDNGCVAYYALSVKKGGTSDIINQGDYQFITVDGVNYLSNYVGTDTKITLPASYNGQNYMLGDHAFDGYTPLRSITIPSSVTGIGDYAFYSCYNLTNITIPESVTNIGEGAFAGCYRLVEVINNSSLDIVKGEVYNGRAAYYALSVKKGGTSDVVNQGDYQFITANGVNYLVNYVGTDIKITLPASYNGQNYRIKDYAFYCCESLTEVIIPNGVTSIGEYAFAYCRSLTSLTIPDSVTSVDNSAFYCCTSLTSVNIPASITGIGRYAFSGCESLTEIIIPVGVTSIGGYAFAYCRSLTSITIPEGVTNIGDSAFLGCRLLTNITIPASVTSIGGKAFAQCHSLTDINVNENNKNFKSIDGNLYSIGGELIQYAIGKRDASFVIPDGVTSIGDSAFYSCTWLKRVIIPVSVVSIGDDVFYSCNILNDITYKGTVEQWNKITKGRYWIYNFSTDCVIHCEDDNIDIQYS